MSLQATMNHLLISPKWIMLSSKKLHKGHLQALCHCMRDLFCYTIYQYSDMSYIIILHLFLRIVFLGYINPTGQECIRPEVRSKKYVNKFV